MDRSHISSTHVLSKRVFVLKIITHSPVENETMTAGSIIP